MSNPMLFWGGAVAMVVVAFLFLLPSLLGRGKEVGIARRENNLAIFQQRLDELKADREGGELSAEQFDQAEADLKRELLADLEGEEEQVQQSDSAGKVGVLVTLVLIPLIAFGIYAQIGSPEALDLQAATEVAEQQQSAQAFEDAVAQLEKKLQQEPNNPDGWMMLAKSYGYLGRGDKVMSAYQQAIHYAGEEVNPQLLVEYAEALAAENGGEWLGEPMAQLNKALEVDPKSMDALWISGHVHFDLGRYEQALDFWERLAENASNDDPEIVQLVNEAAFGAQEKLGLERRPLLDLAVAPAGAALNVSVTLDPALQEQVTAEDVVFVYAKAQGRKGPPLAAQRLTVADLPTTVRLDDSMAMMPGNTLSSVDMVIVGAKITKSGVATGGEHLVGEVESMSSTTELVSVEINRQLQ